jgi:hypothetical protein
MLSKNPNRQEGISMIDTIQAKQCALIAVDEVLKSYPHAYDIEKESTKSGEDIIIITNTRSNIGYWNEVKQEIEKL